MKPQTLATVSPELAAALAAQVAATLLRSDETLRTNQSTAHLLLDTIRPFRASNLTIPTDDAPVATPVRLSPPGSALDGLSDELAAELAEVNAGLNKHAAMQMAMQRVSAVLPLVKAEARKLGLVFDEKAPGALDGLRESLKAYRRAAQAIVERDNGEVVDTPAVSARPAPVASKQTRLRDVYPQWKASKPRKRATLQAAEKALTLYEEATGNPPIATLTRS